MVSPLKKWGIKYYEAIFSKLVYPLFIEDRNLFHKEDWSRFIDKDIKKIKILKKNYDKDKYMFIKRCYR
jgi:hypothetical protein